MRDLRILLTHLAALVAATTAGCDDTAGGSGCGGGMPSRDITVSPVAACAALAGDRGTFSGVSGGVSLSNCSTICGSRGLTYCTLPPDYTQAFDDANPIPDAGGSPEDASGADAPGDAVADAGQFIEQDGSASLPTARCPAVTSPIPVVCNFPCLGRQTTGSAALLVSRGLSAGAYFAACAYLEAVSVHAFARLATELAHVGAPAALVTAALCAEHEEVRHAAVMGELARRFGAEPQTPGALQFANRSLLELAVENAVEGCVRETFGAAVGLLCAERTPLADARPSLRALAADECSHAELSWQVHAWILPRLDEDERRLVRQAMRKAVQELRLADDPLSEEARVISGTPPLEAQRRLAALLDRDLYDVAA